MSLEKVILLCEQNTSYRGVKKHKYSNKWVASITIEGKQMYLGLYITPKDAAEAVDNALMQNPVNYWKLNFPDRYAPPSVKECNCCAKSKPIDEFTILTRSTGQDYPAPVCLACEKAKSEARVTRFETKHGVDPNMHYRIQGDIPTLRVLMSKVKSRAISVGREYDLDLNFILHRWEQQNGRCAISGVPMVITAGKGRLWNGVSIDRIDSSKGYTKDNVQLVCLRANQAKMDMSMSEFTEFCHTVLAYQQEKASNNTEF